MLGLPARIAKGLCRSLGFELRRARAENDVALRRQSYLHRAGVDVVFDVGASTGRYGAALRACGYRGRILSFEPLPSAFAHLTRRARNDTGWDCFPFALGAVAGRLAIHVAGNSVSSSLLPMTAAHLAAAPESAVTGTEAVEIRRLDEVAAAHLSAGARPFLKIDVQGFERDVLAGCGELTPRLAGIEIEMSMVELYGGQILFREIVDWMDDRGFVPASFERGLTDAQNLRFLQLDGIFLRPETAGGAERWTS